MAEIEEQLQGKRVLVTGAAGFIGSRLVKALLDLHAEVVAVVDEEPDLTRLELLLANPKLHLTCGSLTNVSASRSQRYQLENIDLVAHLGLHIPDSHSFGDQCRDNISLNLLPTVNLIQSLGDSVQGICFASSVAVYGCPNRLLVREDDLPAPISSYAVTKLAIEHYLRAYGHVKKIPVTILRYATVYGPGELRHRAIPNFLDALIHGQSLLIYGDGSEVRDYVYVDDVIRATICSLVRKPDRVLNIGSGRGYSTLEVARQMIRLCSSDVEPQFLSSNEQNTSLLCDISAAKKTLDYTPQTSLEEGLMQEIEWYRKKALADSPIEIHNNMDVAERKEGPGRWFSYSWWKGILERLLAFLAIVASLPILVLIAFGIRMDSPGSPIFVQERVGKNGRHFKFYKFRCMPADNDDSEYKSYIYKYLLGNVPYRVDENGQGIYKVDGAQVTRFGALLRKTNLDELPQLFNVLKGEMSFIGPRPDVPFAVRMYKDWHRGRLRVKPGITGLWQVCGRKNLSFEDMVRLDIDYVNRQSPLLDAKIALLTVRTILSRDGS